MHCSRRQVMRQANPLRLRAIVKQVRVKHGSRRKVPRQANLLLVPAIATYGVMDRQLRLLTYVAGDR